MISIRQKDELKDSLADLITIELDVENVLAGSMSALECSREELEAALTELRLTKLKVELAIRKA